MPVLIILGCVGFLFGTGGGALIAITMGAGHKEKANELFSMLVYVSAACGTVNHTVDRCKDQHDDGGQCKSQQAFVIEVIG
mgnify:CR=1 FL=1